MTTTNSNNEDLDIDLPEPYLQTSSTPPLSVIPSPSTTPCNNHIYQKASQNPRKKRTKLAKIGPNVAGNIGKPPKYYKKPDPSAPKITMPCTECGRKFWSWKALFGHMRCHPERQWRGINPPPNYRRPPPRPPPSMISPCAVATSAEAAAAAAVALADSSAIQQEKEPYLLCGAGEFDDMSQEEHEVAAALLMLASCIRSNSGAGGSASPHDHDDDHGHQEGHEPEEAACRFECSSCKKVFGSHQALGGHRASHKNVKGCFAITRSGCDHHGCAINSVEQASGSGSGSASGSDTKESLEEGDDKLAMVALGHQCSICFKMFSSGQALGGHMRCHWERAGEGGSSPMSTQFTRGSSSLLPEEEPGAFGLDLNLPAPFEDDLTLDLRLGL